MLDNLKNSRNLTKIYKRFAEVNDLVYFGKVDHKDSDDPLTGITFANKVEDSHFMHGTFNDYDVTLLKRTSHLTHPHHKDDTYDWTVLRIKLKVQHMPHIFIDAHKYDELLYKNAFAKFPKLRMANGVLAEINESFTDYFHVFAPADISWKLADYLPDFAMQRMLESFQEFDVEIRDSHLWVYMSDEPENAEQLQKMLVEAIWLAEHLEWVFTERV